MVAVDVKPSMEWHQLHNKFYRFISFYDALQWNVSDLSDYLVAICPNGGPVALLRNEKKLVRVDAVGSMKPQILVYSQAGNLISKFQWERSKIFGIHWSRSEELICVQEDGTARIYSLEDRFSQISFGDDVRIKRVLESQMSGDTLMVLTKDFEFYFISDVYRPFVSKLLIPMEILEKPAAWTLAGTKGNRISLIFSLDSTLVFANSFGESTSIPIGAIVRHIALSPDGTLLAIMSHGAYLSVYSLVEQVFISKLSLKEPLKVECISWCGTDAVCISEQFMLHLVAPSGVLLSFPFDSQFAILSEVDGVRILSSDACGFIQKVPASVERVFQIGSACPAACLFDALEYLEKQSPKADENIRLISPNLDAAVHDCIDAATHEFQAARQKLLLKAASLGRAYLNDKKSEDFIRNCQLIRILNQLRLEQVGCPMTIVQLHSLSLDKLVLRLLSRNMHLLACKLSKYLDMPAEPVMVHWASAKIRVFEGREDVVKSIVSKLKDFPSISYTEIAKSAYRIGHVKLAIKVFNGLMQLLEYEQRSAEQVPLLLNMQEDEAALLKAIESNDSDLINFVLFFLKRKYPLPQFFRIINCKPVAYLALENFCRVLDTELLEKLYFQADDLYELSKLSLLRLENADIKKKVAVMTSISKEMAAHKEKLIDQRLIEEEARLLQMQLQMEKDLEIPLNGKSLMSTIEACLANENYSKAVKLKAEFRVSDKKQN